MFFCTSHHVDDLPDAAEQPPTFKEQYTVTGVIRKVRVKRAQPLALGPLVVNGTEILLFKVRDAVFATDVKCPHQSTSLVLSDIEDMDLVCPAHNWRFSLANNGACKLQPPTSLKTYPVQIDEQGMIFVGFDNMSATLFCAPDF
jgi:nitrite reductase/ring-hydroxylating ferredoxin subunit